MKPMRFFLPPLALANTLSLAVRAQAQTLTTLASFTNTNGSSPCYGSLVQTTNGNYYGTTHSGKRWRRRRLSSNPLRQADRPLQFLLPDQLH
jgi:hypothetical protein